MAYEPGDKFWYTFIITSLKLLVHESQKNNSTIAKDKDKQNQPLAK
jgi:hypothetical protein